PAATDEASAVAFVARDDLLQDLLSLWRTACAGDPRIAFVQGAAGLGKTCLTAELARRVAASGGQVRCLVCRPEAQHQPLAPVLGVLAEAGGVEIKAEPGQRCERMGDQFEGELALPSDVSRSIVLSLFERSGQAPPAAKDAV